mmetsp:Transcript_20256/g.52930  ORF Transcript_20256/g.52930 Transcript_20256/m.52930 type:complete len:278 (+) Transcript_20256:483-1316(+)
MAAAHGRGHRRAARPRCAATRLLGGPSGRVRGHKAEATGHHAGSHRRPRHRPHLMRPAGLLRPLRCAALRADTPQDADQEEHAQPHLARAQVHALPGGLGPEAGGVRLGPRRLARLHGHRDAQRSGAVARGGRRGDAGDAQAERRQVGLPGAQLQEGGGRPKRPHAAKRDGRLRRLVPDAVRYFEPHDAAPPVHEEALGRRQCHADTAAQPAAGDRQRHPGAGVPQHQPVLSPGDDHLQQHHLHPGAPDQPRLQRLRRPALGAAAPLRLGARQGGGP